MGGRSQRDNCRIVAPTDSIAKPFGLRVEGLVCLISRFPLRDQTGSPRCRPESEFSWVFGVTHFEIYTFIGSKESDELAD
jgi:hypothetical protein